MPIASDALGVGASVQIRCTMIASPIAFGVYSLANPAPLDAVGSISLNCSQSVVNFIMHVRLGQGQYPAPGSTSANPMRRMSNGSTGRLRYGIYRNASRTQTWGDSIGSAYFPGTGPSPVSIPVYGRIPALQTVAPGTYQDNVLATVYF